MNINTAAVNTKLGGGRLHLYKGLNICVILLKVLLTRLR